MIKLFTILLLTLLMTRTSSAQNSFTEPETGIQYRVEKFIDANFPVGMAFAPDGSLFYNEKNTGRVRLIRPDSTRQFAPVIELPTDGLQERGLLGIALDPAFEQNGMIWVMHTAPGTARDFPANQLVRFHVENGSGADPEVMFSAPITNGQLLHNGGNVHFDAAGYLYLSLGDYGEAANAQNLDVPQGKVHRFQVTEAGLIPAPGNPYPDSSIYAHGFRNPFDFTIDLLNGNIFATENGLHCDDEVNRVLPGFNYGWGENYVCAGTDLIGGLRLYAPPLLSYTPTIAPTGIVIYDHPAAPAWQGDVFFCGWNFGEMFHAVLNEASRIERVNVLDLGGVTCRLDIAVGPEGALYFGTVDENGGAIYRLVPQP